MIDRFLALLWYEQAFVIFAPLLILSLPVRMLIDFIIYWRKSRKTYKRECHLIVKAGGGLVVKRHTPPQAMISSWDKNLRDRVRFRKALKRLDAGFVPGQKMEFRDGHRV